MNKYHSDFPATAPSRSPPLPKVSIDNVIRKLDAQTAQIQELQATIALLEKRLTVPKHNIFQRLLIFAKLSLADLLRISVAIAVIIAMYWLQQGTTL